MSKKSMTILLIIIIIAVVAGFFLVVSSDSYKSWRDRRFIRQGGISDPINPAFVYIFGTLNKLLQIANQNGKLTKSDIEAATGSILEKSDGKERIAYEASSFYFKTIRYDESFGLIELKINPEVLVPFYEVQNRFGENYQESPNFPDSDIFIRRYTYQHYSLSFRVSGEEKRADSITIDFISE